MDHCAAIMILCGVRCYCILCVCIVYYFARVSFCIFFFFQAEDGIRDYKVTGVQTCALPISSASTVGLPRESMISRPRISVMRLIGLSSSQQGFLEGRLLHRPVELAQRAERSEEHTSELQSPCNLVCRLLLEKKKISNYHSSI